MRLLRCRALHLSMFGAMVFTLPALAAVDEKLKPSDIQAIFAVGKPFTATAPSGKIVTITLNPDGSATVAAKGKKKGTKGKWRVSDNGYCSIWGKGVENCYTIRKAGKRYEVVNQHGILVANWNAP